MIPKVKIKDLIKEEIDLFLFEQQLPAAPNPSAGLPQQFTQPQTLSPGVPANPAGNPNAPDGQSPMPTDEEPQKTSEEDSMEKLITDLKQVDESVEVKKILTVWFQKQDMEIPEIRNVLSKLLDNEELDTIHGFILGFIKQRELFNNIEGGNQTISPIEVNAVVNQPLKESKLQRAIKEYLMYKSLI